MRKVIVKQFLCLASSSMSGDHNHAHQKAKVMEVKVALSVTLLCPHLVEHRSQEQVDL